MPTPARPPAPASVNLTPPPPPPPAEPVEAADPVDPVPAEPAPEAVPALVEEDHISEAPAADDFIVHDDASAAAAPSETVSYSSGPDVEHAVEALEHGEVVEDDDVVNLPPPEPSALAYRSPSTKKGPRPPIYTTLAFKRTVIPILLTLGVCLPIIAMLCFAWRDSAIGILGEEAPSIPITFLIVGVIMLAFAVLNMVQVKRQMAAAS